MTNLQTRTLSSIVLIFILASILYFGGTQGLVLLVVLTTVISQFELRKLFFKEKLSLPFEFTFMSVPILISLLIGFQFQIVFSAVLFLFLFIFTITFSFFHPNTQFLQDYLSKCLIASIYLGFFPATLLLISQDIYGMAWFLFLLVVVFSGDVFAYLFGGRFGKHKIIPHLSPKKSIEGAFGGLLGSLFIGLIFNYFYLSQSISEIVLLTFLMSIFAQSGDFFESLLKRNANVKDSGRILPGHGGILDRIDGVLFAAPILWLWLVFAGQK